MASGSFGGWLAQTFATLSEDWCIRIAMTSWALWKIRNDSVWKNKVARISSVLFVSSSVLDNWRRVQGDQHDPVAEFLTPEDGVVKSSKPGF